MKQSFRLLIKRYEVIRVLSVAATAGLFVTGIVCLIYWQLGWLR